MKQSTDDRVKGKVDEVAGKVKEKIGDATGNPRLKEEGQDQQAGGKIQRKIGEVEKVFED